MNAAASGDPRVSDEVTGATRNTDGPIHQSLGRTLWILSAGCFGIVAFLSMVMVPVVPLIPELDLSWCGALSYFLEKRADFGTHVVFTYGPLGHFAGFAYTEYLATARVISEILLKGITTALCCWAFCELRPVIRILFATCIIFFLGNFEETYFFAIVLATLLLLRTSGRNLVLHSLLGVFLAIIALIKFTYFTQAICAVGAVGAYCVAQRRSLSFAALAIGFCGGILGCWVLTGQRLEHFADYVRHSLEISTGYNAAMLMETSNIGAIWVALFCVVLFVIQLLLLLLRNDKTRMVIGSLFLIAMLFLLWKHAFTRWENHAHRFFFFFPELLIASWLLDTNDEGSGPIPLAVTLVATVSALIPLTPIQSNIISNAVPRLTTQLRYAGHVLGSYRQFDSERQQRLRDARSEFYLPKIRAIVGDRPVDVFGYRQGIALLNELNYIPRPVFQGYSAYTAPLIALNTEYYQSNKRPEFVISKLDTIDHRFPTLDDSKVLLELLYHYQPVVTEKAWQLWKAAIAPEIISPQPLSSVLAKLNQDIAIPEGGPIWLQLNLTETRWGKLRSLLYKSAPVMIELTDEAGQTSRYRIVPSMATTGCLLNPKVSEDDELLTAARGGRLPTFRSLKISTDEKLFKKSFQIRFSILPHLGAP